MQKRRRPGLAAARPVLVAIPVRDEVEDIGPCLLALAAQRAARIDAVILCLNNCRDGTADVVRAIGGHLPFRMHPIEVTLPDGCASAGRARRIAMERAADLAGRDGVLLTTDADARLGPDWITANLAALAAGADAVAGRAVIEPEGAKRIPAHLHAIDARECAYATLLDEMRALLEPDPADPWPRHDEESGASIAVTLAAYRRAGGMPAVPLGEDRTFFDALRRIDARVRHAPDIAVIVSARIEGRAHGGMADTMRRRIEQPDPFLDARLEPAADALRRARLRRRLREIWSMPGRDVVRGAAARLGLAPARLAELVTTEHFGAAWAAVEAASPVLRHRARVPLEALSTQTARALRIRDGLRLEADQVGTALRVAAE
jgi:Glycosyltransferase like family 2